LRVFIAKSVSLLRNFALKANSDIMATEDHPPRPTPEQLAAMAAAAAPAVHVSFGARLRTYFLTGLILTGPVAITAYLTWSFITWVDNLVRPFIPDAFLPETYLPFYLPGYGLIIVFVALTFLGFITANLIGRTLVELGEKVLSRMPVVRPVYKSLKQIFQTVFSQSGSSFRKVGLVEFPSPGMWSMVFLSQPPSTDVAERLPDPEDYVSVFLPCTPNPTTGFFFYVKRNSIIDIDIAVEDAATLIISGGMIQPNAIKRDAVVPALPEKVA
jgi:uncharacterized membrane protein